MARNKLSIGFADRSAILANGWNILQPGRSYRQFRLGHSHLGMSSALVEIRPYDVAKGSRAQGIEPAALHAAAQGEKLLD